jgi:hypothetical protein
VAALERGRETSVMLRAVRCEEHTVLADLSAPVPAVVRALMLVLVSYLSELSLPALVHPALGVAMTYWHVPGGEGDLSTAKEELLGISKPVPVGPSSCESRWSPCSRFALCP